MLNLKKHKKLKKFTSPVPGSEVGFWTQIMVFHYVYNVFIVLVGLGLILWGGWMVSAGIEGEIDWIINIFGNESSLYNATPGVFLVVIGFLIIVFARSKVDYKK